MIFSSSYTRDTAQSAMRPIPADLAITATAEKRPLLLPVKAGCSTLESSSRDHELSECQRG